MTGKVWAVTMVKNEEDVIADTLRHILSEGVDGVIIADNGSSDLTADRVRDVIRSTLVPVYLVSDQVLGYYQSAKMTHLAAQAAELGAEWVIPFDADELWCGRGAPLAEVLRAQPREVRAVGLPEFSHVGTGGDDTSEVNHFRRMVWRQAAPSTYPKIAYRWDPEITIHQGNDAILDKRGRFLPYSVLGMFAEIRHFQARSLAQYEGKIRRGAAAYEAAPDLAPSLGSHWRAWGKVLKEEGGLERVYRERFFFDTPGGGYVRDPAPWCKWEW